ncbi:MFS general substrate transporter [Karstenula rhodostoma CBS 690.94]|uniref:MFS general substrate transporter n=1 Tax=Karstenula rhodostoma CBS 690.94 TaxID=1392251 RepID=A0A9P4P2W2_9PLEO|nr:MFS general substrate transporter [Karstenula rhodostoma CBS 690.94]
MADEDGCERRSWRRSKTLVVFTATLGLFTENFLYGFVVPILPYMIEKRLGLDPALTQRFTTELLFILGLISVPAAPIIGHFADQTTSRKIPLLIALVGCTVGTLLVALTPSVWAVYAGRILQGISGTGAWIVGFAMLTDAAGSKHLGKTLGFSGSFITAGVLTGPVISGAFLQWFGYWVAWSVPLALIAICFVARLAIVEERRPAEPKTSTSAAQDRNETSPLLFEESGDQNEAASSSQEEVKEPATRGFYTIMFSHGATYAALLNVTAFSMIISGFDTTLPVHLREEFGWRPAPIGSIFLGIQIPSMILGPFVGWLRDRIGLRWPTTLGWALSTPLFWFLGVPGKDNFLGVGDGAKGQAAFVATIIGVGVIWSFVRGAGTFQLTTIMHELKAQDPDIFGPGGGSSRTFSMTETSFAIGLVLGPIITGSLADTFGFYYATSALACVSIVASISSWMFFTHKAPAREPEADVAA